MAKTWGHKLQKTAQELKKITENYCTQFFIYAHSSNEVPLRFT